MHNLSPKVVGSKGDINSLPVPADKKKKKIQESLHFIRKKRKPYDFSSIEYSDWVKDRDHELDPDVYHLIKHETDEVFAYMSENEE